MGHYINCCNISTVDMRVLILILNNFHYVGIVTGALSWTNVINRYDKGIWSQALVSFKKYMLPSLPYFLTLTLTLTLRKRRGHIFFE